MITLLFQLLLSTAISPVAADEHAHTYLPEEQVVIWASSVGPIDNKQESYSYYQHLPFCQAEDDILHSHETLGEQLLGQELVYTGLPVSFRVDVPATTYCALSPSRHEMQQFQNAIQYNYYAQFVVDDLPLGAYLGEVDEGELFLYEHQHYEFHYNGNQIIGCMLDLSQPKQLSVGVHLNFSYSVTWQETDIQFKDRFDVYLDTEFFEHKIHWFAIGNSLVMICFLVAFVMLLLARMLRMDLQRYQTTTEFDGISDYQQGWKQVHGDVFRRPQHMSVLAACLGSGYQLTFTTLILILYTILGDIYEQQAAITTSGIYIYCACSVVNGFVSARFFKENGGRNWINTMLLSASLFPGMVSIIVLTVNMIAMYYQSSRAIPFVTILIIMLIWSLLVLPLCAFGTFVGKNWRVPSHPARVNPIPRPVPENVLWYQDWIFLVICGGLLPFGSIFIEMYFIFTSLWAAKVYYVYGFMLMVTLILLTVSACVAVVGTYFLLSGENHRWHWTSFMVGGSVGMYIYAYAIYYFFAKTRMYGMFQSCFYFAYMAIACFAVALMCGSLGFSGSRLFVRRIYTLDKMD